MLVLHVSALQFTLQSVCWWLWFPIRLTCVCTHLCAHPLKSASLLQVWERHKHPLSWSRHDTGTLHICKHLCQSQCCSDAADGANARRRTTEQLRYAVGFCLNWDPGWTACGGAGFTIWPAISSGGLELPCSIIQVRAWHSGWPLSSTKGLSIRSNALGA